MSWHTFYVPLAMGSNAITVTVTSAVDDRSGSDTLTVTRVPDTTPPTVSSIAPAADAASVATTAVVVIGFSEPVDAASLDAGHLSLRDTATSTLVPVMVSTSVDGQWASMTPLSPLNASTAYEVRVQNVADLAGNVMATSFTSHFTTASVVTDATPPSVVAIDPAQGALGVPVTAAIEVQFSEPIDFEGLDFVFRVSDAATGDAIAGSVSALSPVPVTVTFRPVSPLVPGTAYKVQVLASDPAGNPMPAPFISQFTTAP
ncbi:Ig-like domain-containing protein [uncultured Piscinibacter sp.]|uniref:Ig-like domain-containing protein n=1 Tax=uncultured Piscinibacter sp. TaxID=1131835 RepID=UPI002634CD8F|nr:Ig-like domain-containing protein [uncultured Piscinibacter sp.]